MTTPKTVVYCALFAALMLSGCATQDLYEWGSYETDLYRYYNKPATRDEAITRALTLIDNLESRSQKIPPGLYAEVGTFMLEKGDVSQAVEYYKKESAAWPESRQLMQALIETLGRRTPTEMSDNAGENQG